MNYLNNDLFKLIGKLFGNRILFNISYLNKCILKWFNIDSKKEAVV